MLRPATLLTIALWLMACTITPIDKQITSGIADPQTGGGIGGTGITCSSFDSEASTLAGAGIACLANTGGIGGTGLRDWSGGIGGTGVFGTITGFGSLIINGLHVDFAADQKVESLLGGVTAQDLHIGQVVAVQANNIGQGLVAQRIVLQTALVGQVEAIDRLQSELVVAGERVVILPNLSNVGFSLEQLKVGDTLAISGARASAKLYASHVAQAAESSLTKAQTAIASGVITHINNTQFTLDNSLIVTLSDSETAKWTTGDFVSVELDSSNQLQNNNKPQKPSKPFKKWYDKLFDDQVERVSIEYTTAGTEVVDANKPAKVKRKVRFFSRDKANKMRLEGSLQTDVKAWQRSSAKELKLKLNSKDLELGVKTKKAKKAAIKTDKKKTTGSKKESNKTDKKTGKKTDQKKTTESKQAGANNNSSKRSFGADGSGEFQKKK